MSSDDIKSQLIQNGLDPEVADVILQISKNDDDALRIAIDPTDTERCKVIKMVKEEVGPSGIFWGDYKISQDDPCFLL